MRSDGFNLNASNNGFVWVRKIGRFVYAIVLLVFVVLSVGCVVEDPDEGGIIGSGVVHKGSINEAALAANGTVDVKSIDGQRTQLSINSSSQFSAASLPGAAPWVLRLQLSSDRAVYAIAFEMSTRNINRFSDVSLRQWFAQQSLDIDTEFSESRPFTELPTAAEYADAVSGVFGLIDPVLKSYDATAEGVISGEYEVMALVPGVADRGTNAFLMRNTVLLENGAFQFSITDPTTLTQSTTRSSIRLGSSLIDIFSIAPGKPSSVKALGSALDEIIVVWEPVSDDVSVVGYEITRDGVIVATTSYPVFIDSALVPQEYSYEITAVDAAGNRSEPSEIVRVSPLQSDDTTPPPAPTLLTELETTDSSIHLLWAQPSINDVVSFNLFRGNDSLSLELYSQVTSTDAIDTLVIPGQVFCYQVQAVDASGNTSERSEVLCVSAGRSNPVNGEPIEPLADWVVPDIGSLNCNQTILAEQVLQGLSVIAAGCYSVPDSLILGPGATMRISAGVVLIFAMDATLTVTSSATLTANGTRNMPVVFTGETDVPGAWGGIEFDGSVSTGNLLRGAVVQYAGGGNSLAAIATTPSRVRFRIEDTLVRFNQKRAFHFGTNDGLIDEFQGNRVTENESIGQIKLDLLPALGGSSEFSGNFNSDIEVPFNFYTNRTIAIPNLGVPLRWNGVSMERSALTINPGVILTMVQRSAISVNGTFTAAGTADDPIVMSGVNTSSDRNWAGILLSGRGDKTINHVQMSDAGAVDPMVSGAIDVSCTVENAARVSVDNVEISDSLGWGIFIDQPGCDVQIGDNVAFFNNALGDIRLP